MHLVVGCPFPRGQETTSNPIDHVLGQRQVQTMTVMHAMDPLLPSTLQVAVSSSCNSERCSNGHVRRACVIYMWLLGYDTMADGKHGTRDAEADIVQWTATLHTTLCALIVP